MIRVIFFGYRKWAFDILRGILSKKKAGYKVVKVFTTKESEAKFDSLGVPFQVINPKIMRQGSFLNKMKDLRPDAILFYGWSWIVPKEMLKFKCICLHPSPLPKYRGGSPLQHQIMAGEGKSAVTLFLMDEGMDTGDILMQKPFKLEGNIEQIFDRIVTKGIEATQQVITKLENGTLSMRKQDNSKATIFKRRNPSQSELNLLQISKMSAKEFHDFVRALQDPYPNAYIIAKDKKKVYITHTRLEK
jgi:methionyl-tRNA formyltransferase